MRKKRQKPLQLPPPRLFVSDDGHEDLRLNLQFAWEALKISAIRTRPLGPRSWSDITRSLSRWGWNSRFHLRPPGARRDLQSASELLQALAHTRDSQAEALPTLLGLLKAAKSVTGERSVITACALDTTEYRSVSLQVCRSYSSVSCPSILTMRVLLAASNSKPYGINSPTARCSGYSISRRFGLRGEFWDCAPDQVNVSAMNVINRRSHSGMSRKRAMSSTSRPVRFKWLPLSSRRFQCIGCPLA